MRRERLAALTLGLSITLGALARLWSALTDHGIYWPDEIYQSFEPAHKLVFGYALMPWEYLDGARSWALPGVVAAVMKVTSLITGAQSTAYIESVKVMFAVASTLTAIGAARLARTFNAGPWAAALAGALASFNAVSVYFGHRAMSENAAAVTVVWGLAWVLQPGIARRWLIAGASLLGLSVMFRLQMGLCCLGAVLVLAARREWRSLGVVMLVLSVWAVLLGALDAFTWHDAPNAKYGGWFHSALVYIRFNIIEGRGAAWGTAPWWYYFSTLFTAMPALTCVFAVGVLTSILRARGLLFIALLFLALHLWSPHKELRFLVPLIPLLCALVGAGLEVLPWARIRDAAVVLALVAGLISFGTHRRLTMGDLGAYPERAGSSAWGDFASVNRLVHVASTRDDLCGLMVTVAHLAWVGGTTYLHRHAPLYMPGFAGSNAYFNYAIVPAGSGGEVISEDSGLQLVRITGTVCQPDPGYSWRLP